MIRRVFFARLAFHNLEISFNTQIPSRHRQVSAWLSVLLLTLHSRVWERRHITGEVETWSASQRGDWQSRWKQRMVLSVFLPRGGYRVTAQFHKDFTGHRKSAVPHLDFPHLADSQCRCSAHMSSSKDTIALPRFLLLFAGCLSFLELTFYCWLYSTVKLPATLWVF